MSVIVAIVRFVFGFLAAVLAAGIVQVLFVTGLDGLLASLSDSLGLLMLFAATQSAVFAGPFAVLAAVLASWQSIRSGLYFTAVGGLIGIAGFLAQYAGEGGGQTILNRYALAAYAVSGLAGGIAYWLVGVPKKPLSAERTAG